MNINQRNKPAVGRGLILRQLAERAAASSSNSEESPSSISTSTSSESLLDTSKESSSTDFSDSGKDSATSTTQRTISQGRGRILQTILLAKSSLCDDAFVPESVAKPFGNGRGKILAMLAESNKQKEKFVDDESVSNGFASKRTKNMEDRFERMSLGSTDDEPVIKKGTRGTYFLGIVNKHFPGALYKF